MSHLLALDQGTTSSRALVFDASGRVVARAQQEFAQHFPRPGWVEHDAVDIWESQLATAQQALREAGLGAGDIAAIGITNQRETTVLWDRATGEPVHRAIVWQDRRTVDYCERLRAAHGDHLRRTTGLRADPYFSGTKLAWLLDHVDGARARAERGDLAFGTVDAWLAWKLTGGRTHATDVTNASRTLLFDIHRLSWDDTLLDALDIPRAVLPEIVPSSGFIGETEGALFGEPVKIGGVAGDQHAALFGQACLEPGTAKNTYGTGCFMLMNTGSEPVPSEHGLLTTVAWDLGDGPGGHNPVYALEGSVFVAGAAVQWLRDELGLVETAADSEALAASVPDADGVVVVPAFTGLGAPHWDPHARGAVFGLTRGTTRAHLVRATLESLAFQTRDVLAAMEADAGQALAALRVDGGAAANGFLMQFQADMLGVAVERPANVETTAWGAARLAGLAAGVYAPDAPWTAEARFEPQMPEAARAPLLRAWQRAVERARGWAG
ncbi:MAG: glycerol kinase GlpK [Bacteroidota bacterium]